MNIVYIDVQNVHLAIQETGRIVDRAKLYIYLRNKCKADLIYYAVGFRKEYKTFYKKIKNIGYNMLYKKTIRLPNGSIKGNVDIDIAIKSVFDFFQKKVKKAYIITNDGDFNTLVDVFKENGIFGYVMTPNYKKASRLLKQSAEGRIQDMQRIKHLIKKSPTPEK